MRLVVEAEPAPVLENPGAVGVEQRVRPDLRSTNKYDLRMDPPQEPPDNWADMASVHGRASCERAPHPGDA